MNYSDLPVYQHKDLILSALEHNQVIVVESPTGSGKTTQLPVILDSAGYSKNGIIGVTQPRRIAAVSVSEFIARQMGTTIPGPVGYKMRFEDKTDRNTRIKIMTDGILLQEMKIDPWLSKYGSIIVDEAHERSLNIDFILGLLKRVLEDRRDFKVIISSATINAQVFSEYFGECPVVKIDAVTFPVTLIYDPPPVDAASGSPAAADALLAKIESITERLISDSAPGDILIFLPGEKMIKDCMERLVFGSLGPYLHILPLYGRMGKEEQERVFEETPKGKTKVVIATNIAETSVTIDGITAVIDSGLFKLNYYNPKTFTSSLIETPVSKASANQRKGRAGRTREGSCYRLYTRRDFDNRRLFTTEEIFRTDLSEVVLRMADLGITEFEEFDFISLPGREGLIAAVETLNLLDALESDRTLSRIGKLMTEFPLLPRHSRIIVEAILKYPDVIQQTIIAAAFLSTQSPYILPPGEETDARKAHHSFRDSGGDFISYLKLYKAFTEAAHKQKFCEKNYLDERAMNEIANVVEQLEQIVTDMNIPLSTKNKIFTTEDTEFHGGRGHSNKTPCPSKLSEGQQNSVVNNSSFVEDYLCAIGKGLVQFVCVREGRDLYRSLTADRILIHPGSVMFRLSPGEPQPAYIVAGEIVRTTRMYAMSVSPLSRSALDKISPGLFTALGGSYWESGSKYHAEPKPKRARDFTNSIKIKGEVFEIETIKGKKEVKLPWEKLKNIRERLMNDSMNGLVNGRSGREAGSIYKGLRGTITIDNKYTLLKGEKLSLILTLLPLLNPEESLKKELGSKKYDSRENLDKLLKQLPGLVTPALWKKPDSKKAEGKKVAKELGFTGLFTDGNGNYRIKCCRSFHTSLNESIASLETLIDELGDDVDIEKKHIVNQCYRRLSDYLS